MKKILQKERRKYRKTFNIINKNKQNLPILYINKSERHLYGCINEGSKTLYCFHSKDDQPAYNVARASEMGSMICKKIKDLKITKFIVNTCGNKYHGRIKSFVESANGGKK